jgi:hypothetical protein
MPQPHVCLQKPLHGDYTPYQHDGKVKGKLDKVGKTPQHKSSIPDVEVRVSKAVEPLKKEGRPQVVSLFTKKISRKVAQSKQDSTDLAKKSDAGGQKSGSHLVRSTPEMHATRQVEPRRFDLVQQNLAKLAKSIKKTDESENEARIKARERMCFWEVVPEKLGGTISSLRTKLAVSHMYTIPAFSPITADFVFKGKRYGLLKSSVTNISQKPYASCGSSSAREILVIDPENATLLNWHYKKLKQLLLQKHTGSLAGLSTEEILTIVKEYVQKNIFPSWNNPSIGAMTEELINEGKNNRENLIYDNQGEPHLVLNIEDFVRRGIGVCRHHALVTGYLLDHLCRDTGIPFAPLGIVQNIRDNIPGGAHVWVTLLEKDKKFHLDTLWNTLQEFGSEEKQAELVKKGYGDLSIQYQVAKAKASDTVFKAAALSRGLKTT